MSQRHATTGNTSGLILLGRRFMRTLPPNLTPCTRKLARRNSLAGAI